MVKRITPLYLDYEVVQHFKQVFTGGDMSLSKHVNNILLVDMGVLDIEDREKQITDLKSRLVVVMDNNTALEIENNRLKKELMLLKNSSRNKPIKTNVIRGGVSI